MKIAIKNIASTSILAWSGLTFSQNLPVTVPVNVVQLSASAVADVHQDLLSMSLSTTRDGSDAALVQSQLKVALDSALVEARRARSPANWRCAPDSSIFTRARTATVSKPVGRVRQSSCWRGATLVA